MINCETNLLHLICISDFNSVNFDIKTRTIAGSQDHKLKFN